MNRFCKPWVAAMLALGAGAAFAAEPVPAAAGAPGYHVVDRIPMGDGWWDYANVDPVHRNLFVSRGNGVFKMELDSGLIDNRFIPGSEGRAVIPIPGTDMMLTTVAGYSSAIFFTSQEGKIVKLIELTQASDSAVWEPTVKRAWVMGGHGEASLLDPVTLKQTGTVEFGEPLEFSATDGKGRVFVNGSESASVLVADARSLKVVGRWKMKDCEDPSGMAYVDHADVILSVCFNNMLKVLDARNGKEIATIPVGKGADAVIYDHATHRAFVPSAYDGLLTVVAVNSRTDIQVLEQATTQIGTRTGTIDEETGTIYLPTARMSALNKLGWPEALPGTVQLLVLKPGK
jgi:DNA-binding beta-propeller fold protein YncE